MSTTKLYIRPAIEKQNTQLRNHDSLSVEKRVAVTLWYLAEFRSIGHLFGIARCIACVIVHETCAAIVDLLLKLYIIFPEGDRVTDIVDGFLNTWGYFTVSWSCGWFPYTHISPSDESY